MKAISLQAIMALFILFAAACGTGSNQKDAPGSSDTTQTEQADTLALSKTSGDTSATEAGNNAGIKSSSQEPIVMVYNFHLTNRCPSCRAIEEATTKTLETYFGNELKSGKIIRKILNVEDEANAAICEKFEASGSGMYVTRIFKGKETTTDLTGDGFKYARNKQEKFIEILKTTISDYLKS